jgi:hypothetical protein
MNQKLNRRKKPKQAKKISSGRLKSNVIFFKKDLKVSLPDAYIKMKIKTKKAGIKTRDKSFFQNLSLVPVFGNQYLKKKILKMKDE